VVLRVHATKKREPIPKSVSGKALDTFPPLAGQVAVRKIKQNGSIYGGSRHNLGRDSSSNDVIVTGIEMGIHSSSFFVSVFIKTCCCLNQ
jgi:hypothetical protein